MMLRFQSFVVKVYGLKQLRKVIYVFYLGTTYLGLLESIQ
jgi:hypothetical protein